MLPSPREGMLQSPREGLVLKAPACLKKSLRSSQLTVCALTDKGKSVRASDIKVKSPLGQGSYGEVFEVSSSSRCPDKFRCQSLRLQEYIYMYSSYHSQIVYKYANVRITNYECLPLHVQSTPQTVGATFA